MKFYVIFLITSSECSNSTQCYILPNTYTLPTRDRFPNYFITQLMQLEQRL
jgi:hypothetical protein